MPQESLFYRLRSHTHASERWFDAAGVALFSVAKLHMATKDGSKPDSSPFSSVARSYTWQRRMVQCRTIRPFHRSGNIHMTPRRGSMPNKLLHLSVARLYTWQRRMDQTPEESFFSRTRSANAAYFHGSNRVITGVFMYFSKEFLALSGVFLASCSSYRVVIFQHVHIFKGRSCIIHSDP